MSGRARDDVAAACAPAERGVAEVARVDIRCAIGVGVARRSDEELAEVDAGGFRVDAGEQECSRGAVVEVDAALGGCARVLRADGEVVDAVAGDVSDARDSGAELIARVFAVNCVDDRAVEPGDDIDAAGVCAERWVVKRRAGDDVVGAVVVEVANARDGVAERFACCELIDLMDKGVVAAAEDEDVAGGSGAADDVRDVVAIDKPCVAEGVARAS